MGACRRIHLHGILVEPFLNPICSTNVWVRAKTLMGYPWVGQNVDKRGTKWEINRNLPMDLFLHRIMSFLSGCKPTWYTLVFLGPYLEVNMFLRLGQVFFCIIAYNRRMVSSSYVPTKRWELWLQARPH
jgi:hypothetical protein